MFSEMNKFYSEKKRIVSQLNSMLFGFSIASNELFGSAIY